MKKIIAIISACLVGILLTVTVILACTPFNATIVLPKDAIAVEVYKNGTAGNTYHFKDSETFKKIIELMEKSKKENNLSSLFQGAKGFDAEIINESKAVSDITASKEGQLVMCFYFDGVTPLKWKGENYVNPNSDTKESVKYDRMYVEVDNTSNFTEYSVYLVDSTDKSSESYWNIKLIAHQSELYDYITNLE